MNNRERRNIRRWTANGYYRGARSKSIPSTDTRKDTPNMKRLLAFFARLFDKWAGTIPPLTRPAMAWFARIKPADIQAAINEAFRLASASDATRRAAARDFLKDLVWRNYGLRIPDSIANLLIELVYQRLKTTPSP